MSLQIVTIKYEARSHHASSMTNEIPPLEVTRRTKPPMMETGKAETTPNAEQALLGSIVESQTSTLKEVVSTEKKNGASSGARSGKIWTGVAIAVVTGEQGNDD